MTTGTIINNLTHNRYDVVVSRYGVPAIERWAKAVLDINIAQGLERKYKSIHEQGKATFEAIQARKEAVQAFIAQQKTLTPRPFDPLDPEYNAHSTWQSPAALAYFEELLPKLEEQAVALAQTQMAVSLLLNTERLRLKSAKLVEKQIRGIVHFKDERVLFSRDCSDFKPGDAALVISLDFSSKKAVLHPEKIEKDYIKQLNQAYKNYALSNVYARTATHDIEVAEELLAIQNAKPAQPPGPYKNVMEWHSLAANVREYERVIEGLQREIDKYTAKANEAETEEDQAYFIYVANQINTRRNSLIDDLNTDIIPAYNEQSARPDPQIGQYRRAELVNIFQNQLNEARQRAVEYTAQAEQDRAAFDVERDYVLSRAAEDTEAKGYRAIPKVSAISPAGGVTPAEFFVNESLKYATQIWKPFFITGEVTALNGDKVTIQPDTETINNGRGLINLAPFASSEPFELASGSYGYSVGDKALVKVSNPSTRELEPFGWTESVWACRFKFGLVEIFPDDFPYSYLFASNIDIQDMNNNFKTNGEYPRTRTYLDSNNELNIEWLGVNRNLSGLIDPFPIGTFISYSYLELFTVTPFSFFYRLTIPGSDDPTGYSGYRSAIPGKNVSISQSELIEPFFIDFEKMCFQVDYKSSYYEKYELWDIVTGQKLNLLYEGEYPADLIYQQHISSIGAVPTCNGLRKKYIAGVNFLGDRGFAIADGTILLDGDILYCVGLNEYQSIHNIRKDFFIAKIREDLILFIPVAWDTFTTVMRCTCVWINRDDAPVAFDVLITKDLSHFVNAMKFYNRTIPFERLLTTVSEFEAEKSGCGKIFSRPIMNEEYLNQYPVIMGDCTLS